MWAFLIQMDFSSHSCTYRLSLYNRSAWADMLLFHNSKRGIKKEKLASGYRGASMKLINNHSEFNTESRGSSDVMCVYRCLPGGSPPTLLCCTKLHLIKSTAPVQMSCSRAQIHQAQDQIQQPCCRLAAEREKFKPAIPKHKC